MVETLSVSLSGLAFSFLLHENLKSKYSQEGFLIGEIVEKETKTITDNDQQQVHISRIIKINSAVPWPQPDKFYDGIGRVDAEKIRNFLGPKTGKVVAWYKYKQSSSFSFTFREKIVHRQLADLCSVPPQFFSCCLLISESSDNNSTHSFTQTFMRYQGHLCEQLPTHIENLSDANNTYKSQEGVSETFANLVGGLDINHETTQGINAIAKIQNALQKHTDRLVVDLADAEERLFQLENEVRLLRENAKHKEVTSASNREQNQVNDMMDTDHVTSASNHKENETMDTDPEVGLLSSPTETRRRGRTTSGSGGKKKSLSPVKKSPGGHEIATRSKGKV